MHKAGRYLSIKIEMESLSFRITNIDAPKIPRKRIFFQKLETYIKNDTQNILGGDVNIVEDIPKDGAGGNPTTQHYWLEYIKNINNNNMMDISLKQNPTKKEYNYINNLADFKSSIDRFI